MKTSILEKLKTGKVGVLGLGQENVAVVKFLVKKNAKVVICDQKQAGELGEYLGQIKDLPVQFRLGPHYLDHLEDFTVVFRAPGLPYFEPKIQKAKKAGVEIYSQTKLFFDLCPCPIIGVTGTKGKGTTATLIAEILKWKSKIQNPKSKIYLAGNIGTPPLDFLEKLKPEDIVVLELSSFQLEDLEKSPHIAVVLDIKVDHLDHHHNVQEYIEAKKNIVKFQTKDDFAVINADYEESHKFGEISTGKIYFFSRQQPVERGAWVKNREYVLKTNEEIIPICKTNETKLRGEHNFENISAAIAAASIAGADLESIKQIVKSFKGLEHRLEFVRNFKGISFYNDSFSTMPDTAIAAIKSFAEPIILLVGGSEKGANYLELGRVITQSQVKAIISIGQTAKKIIQAVGETKSIKIIEDIQSMDQAINLALSFGNPGDVVLLSPASASFDKYKNYKERGEIFKKTIANL